MKFMKIMACASMLVLAGGCALFGGRRGVAVQEINDCAVTINGDKQMKNIVMRAAHQKLWVPQAIDDGTVRCTIDLRGHQVVVDVVYSASSFSIRYVSSVNMNYDAATNTISPKYNQWVRNLQREIIGQALK